jgi:hypothetical protein
MTIENSIVTIQVDKEITSLYKDFLEILEDLESDHQIMMGKISQKNGPEYSGHINYFTHEKYEQVRKRILDRGNDHARKIIAFLDCFDFVINKEKVEQIAAQRRVVKKIVINGAVEVR